MSIRKGLPWVALVLTSATPAVAQMTVPDEPAVRRPPTATATAPGDSIRDAAREGRSISLSDESPRRAGSATSVPEFHTVERGDTLWDVTGYYFQNPWLWPRVWGMNPQITNPHWIFPNDQVRLLPPEQAAAQRPQVITTPQSLLTTPVAHVPPQTVFLPDEGWLDRNDEQAAGTIVGAPEDNMLLASGDHAYVEFRGQAPRVGEEFTIYQAAQSAEGGDRPVGHVVRILGTAIVESWNPDRHLATVRIAEAMDGIERGERLAAIPRRLEVVPPVRNNAEVRGAIVATLHPRRLVGESMVVFLNRGSDDHVAQGNRFFVLRRGDAWRQSLASAGTTASGSGLDRDGDGNVDNPPGHPVADNTLPEEVVGELTVINVRPKSATAIVSSSVVEVEVGDLVQMRRGY